MSPRSSMIPPALMAFKAPVTGTKLSWGERLTVFFKGRLGFDPNGGGSFHHGMAFSSIFPGSKVNYSRSVGPLYKNSAVIACVGWMQRTFPEAKLQVTESADDQNGVRRGIPRHPMIKLINKPNPFYGPDVLWAGCLFSLVLNGNAYIHKARNARGDVKELWWIPHWAIKPDWTGSNFITHYLHNEGFGEYKKVAVEDIVHIRFGFNPDNVREGFSPLDLAALPEVDTDNKGRAYTRAILHNQGNPGCIISPKDPNVTIDDETRAELVEWYQQSVAGDNRGLPLVPSIAVNVDKTTWSPEEMALDKILQRPEDRICAALGIPPIVVGLTSGSQTKTYANYREARSAALEQNLIPTHKLFAQQLQLQLLPDFDTDDDHEVDWDYRNVRAMQDELDKYWTRVNNALKSGSLRVDEARIMLGLPPIGGEEGKRMAALATANNGLQQGDEPSGRSSNPDKNLGRPSGGN